MNTRIELLDLQYDQLHVWQKTNTIKPPKAVCYSYCILLPNAAPETFPQSPKREQRLAPNPLEILLQQS
jgi:hypothetical protein